MVNIFHGCIVNLVRDWRTKATRQRTAIPTIIIKPDQNAAIDPSVIKNMIGAHNVSPDAHHTIIQGIISQNANALQLHTVEVESLISTHESDVNAHPSYLKDAPNDGQQYARKNNTWSIVTQGPQYVYGTIITSTDIPDSDGYYIINTAGVPAGITVTLRSGNIPEGRTINIKRVGQYLVTITDPIHAIEGSSSSMTLNSDGDAVTLVWQSGKWRIY